ncbi:Uncharacterised protein [Serratia quinivorans]|uniref:Uncharacterized protein n=1 Tax=Serratia quinivorans TaxID=137545 RepID=A0A380D749_9GAMM|nr:Uncharacterised protein [Serratia quinivorans]SUJ86183.1 Uncharacterised protein [Serratia quinivorans]
MISLRLPGRINLLFFVSCVSLGTFISSDLISIRDRDGKDLTKPVLVISLLNELSSCIFIDYDNNVIDCFGNVMTLTIRYQNTQQMLHKKTFKFKIDISKKIVKKIFYVIIK